MAWWMSDVSRESVREILDCGSNSSSGPNMGIPIAPQRTMVPKTTNKYISLLNHKHYES